MIEISRAETNFPFSLSVLRVEDGSYKFSVNLGEINSFILQYYKFDSKTFDVFNLGDSDFTNFYLGEDAVEDKTIYYPEGQNGPLKNYGLNWIETFSTSDDCSVYLTIPKIPLGLDYYGSDYLGKGKWWYSVKNSFLNQFKIDVSTSPGFESRYSQNIKYTEKSNVFHEDAYYGNDPFTKFEASFPDIEFPGKIYIKLADIKLGTIVSVDQYVRSNLVAPIRYFKMGYTKLRMIRIIYQFVYTKGGDFVSSPFNDDFPCPKFINKSIDHIRSEAKDEVEKFLKGFCQNFSPDLFYNLPAGSPELGDVIGEEEIKKRMWKDIGVYRVILVYKKNAGKPFIAENIFDEPGVYNSLRDRILQEQDPDQPLPEPLKKMTQQEALDFLGVKATNGVLEIVGFEES